MYLNQLSPHRRDGYVCILKRPLDCWRQILWLLKNSFQGISATKFVPKLLNVRSQKTLEFAEITALVPFSTATGFFANS
jgi:hypothetical protein